jgi:capsule biosynthesis phosphatase
MNAARRGEHQPRNPDVTLDRTNRPRLPAGVPVKRLVLDIDGTICTVKRADQSYADVEIRPGVVDALRRYKEMGFEIILFSSRGMRTYSSSVGHLNAHVLPTIVDWLRRHEIPFDELHIGKPWCGHDGFYVDDRAVRPSEFASLDYDQIRALLDAEK